MKEIFLLKLGEIVLKGANKRQFENKLRQNVRRRMKKYGNFDVYILQSTVYVEPMDEEADVDGAWHLDSHIVRVNNRDEIYSKCDIISLHTPLLDDTRGMINAEAIAKSRNKLPPIIGFQRERHAKIKDGGCIEKENYNGLCRSAVSHSSGADTVPTYFKLCQPEIRL